ncbi:MAG: flagellin [Ilumatobacter sp.]|uniref:flagellin N-terminal helical domain-containing protein n=1 Tax=Ilumatobacter sp. TaxID=1967498 RepID=UPI00261D9C1C|nr:flagellin [Ilumatobacter sp.]MDJ0767448.1 flagellin [Ilumatobacter sp.]
MRINQNTMAINAYRNLSTNNVMLGKSLEKLSSGFRINRAADDASGLVISQNLRAQIGGLRQATRNAQDGISVVQTAEGALNEVHNILGRMRDLSVQAANTGTNGSTALDAAQAEITALQDELTRIAGKTEFAGTKLFDGGYGKTAGSLTGFDADGTITLSSGSLTVDGETVTVADGSYTGAEYAATVESAVKAALVGAGKQAEADSFSVSYESVGAGVAVTFENSGSSALAVVSGGGHAVASGSVAAATGTGGQFQVGANAGDTVEVAISAMDTTTLGVDAIDVTTDASGAITAVDNAIDFVSAQRGELGALQNRFESMIANLQVTTENLVASESRIRDTDMAVEMTNFTKGQILSQASTAMLAQANAVPQSVLSLLR